MNRINVYRDNEDSYYTGGPSQILEGWFDRESATCYHEDTRWDGSNEISIPTGSQWNHETLFQTKGGRWVLHWWSQWQGSKETYRFIDATTAREWLLLNNHDDAAAEHFGPVEPERGPGRPEVGQPINVRLGDDLLTRVDEIAAAGGKSRAETVRELVAAGIAQRTA